MYMCTDTYEEDSARDKLAKITFLTGYTCPNDLLLRILTFHIKVDFCDKWNIRISMYTFHCSIKMRTSA